ncbi:glycosyltransferase family 2 protein [Candidatus Latescibacterota bacterium]
MNCNNSIIKPVISAYIITKNEENHIGRALESVLWMDELVVLDSGSTDDTVKIAEKYGTKVKFNEFKNFIEQKNKAMEFCNGEWLFNLDADEEVSPELRKSIEETVYSNTKDKSITIYNISRKTYYMGRWMKHCGWYPEFRARLSRNGHAQWTGEAIHEKLEGNGNSDFISGDLLHRPYDNLGEHLKTIYTYSEIWAEREASRGRKASIPGIFFRPVLKFVKMYILKAGFMDFGPGFFASMMGAWYIFMKYSRLYELSRNFE